MMRGISRLRVNPYREKGGYRTKKICAFVLSVSLLLTVFLPFNLLKAGINSIVTFLIYKTVSTHLIKRI